MVRGAARTVTKAARQREAGAEVEGRGEEEVVEAAASRGNRESQGRVVNKVGKRSGITPSFWEPDGSNWNYHLYRA
jgi:hypothetical protein